MKIAIADNCTLKFSRDLKEHWEKKHEVRYEIGASEWLAQWADLYYIDWWDANLAYLWKLYNGVEGVSRTPDWDNNRKPKIVVRAIDWDVWCGFVPTSQQYVDFVDKVICIAPHIERFMRTQAEFGDKLHVIRPGVNVDRFSFRADRLGYNVAMVTGDIWMMKNAMEGLTVFNSLVRRYPELPWKLHWRGQLADHARYMQHAIDYFIDSRRLKDRVVLYPPVNDMNEWYEQMDFILHPSIKEAFCYAIGEAMTKGIKPVIYDWLGSKDIWPRECIYQTVDEAIDIFMGPRTPEVYRQFIQENYPIERMVRQYDELLGT